MDYQELGKKPISDAKPAGDDVRYDPIYEELSTEIQKLSSPTASGGIDWAKVAKLSASILESSSKNLLVASYLCIAWLTQDNLKGLARGVQVMKDMVDTFWETMYPPVKRMRGRLNAITWWKEHIEAQLPQLPQETWSAEERQALLINLSTLDSALGERMQDAPVLRTMIENLSEKVVVPAKHEPPPPEKKAEPAPTTKAAAPASSAAAPHIDDGTSPEKLLESGLSIIGKAASMMMKQNPYNPIIYQLNRIVAWTDIERLPPTTAGKTMLPPPEAQLVSTLQGMFQSGDWKNLLEAAEPRVRQFLFWLDLSRWVAEASAQLGYSLITEIIAHECLIYTKRLPGLEKLAFSDGTPFANLETRQWLKERSASSSGAEVAAPADSTSFEALVIKETQAAEEKLKNQQIDQALTTLNNYRATAASLREKFSWVLTIGRLLLRANMPANALPFIEEVLTMIDDHHLDRWEPSLAVSGLAFALTGLRAIKDKQNDERAQAVFRRLSVLDPVKAIALT